jgi:argininosuccinate lyase
MQEDKECVFDALDTVADTLEVFAPMLRTARFRVGRMRSAAGAGFINATDCADYLTRKGVPFREAYGVTGRLVARCIELNTTLEELPLEEFQAAHPAYAPDVYAAIALETCLAARNTAGGPSPDAVRAHIADMRAFLAEEPR